MVKSATSRGTGALFGGYPTTSTSGTPSLIVGDSGNNWGQRQAANALAAWDFSDTSRLRADAIYGYHFYDYGSPNSYVGRYSGTVSAYPGYRTGSLVGGNFLSGKGETKDLRLSLAYDGMAHGGLYQGLEELDRLLEQYAQAKIADQGRAHALEHLILGVIRQANLDKELKLDPTKSEHDQNFDAIIRGAHEALSRIRNTLIQDGMPTPKKTTTPTRPRPPRRKLSRKTAPADPQGALPQKSRRILTTTTRGKGRPNPRSSRKKSSPWANPSG